VNNHPKYANSLYYSMINDKDSHIPSPMIILTCTMLHHALLEWQKDKGVHPKASKSKLKADRADPSNNFNNKNGGGTDSSCCTVTCYKILTSRGIADTHRLVMNTWNTLPESYPQRVYTHTLATVKHQIQQGENQTPAVVNSLDAARADNDNLLDYLTSDVALEEPVIRSTAPNIRNLCNCLNDELHIGMPGGSAESSAAGDKCDDHAAIPTTSR
jgi:hypothetical protein